MMKSPRRSTRSSCFSTSPESPTKNPFTSRQPPALPPRLTGRRRSAPAVRSQRRKGPTSLILTSAEARRRIRPSASRQFRAKSLPSGSPPFSDTIFEFVVFQGGRIDQVMRLMAAGIEVQTSDGRFVRFIENDPRRPQEYEEFRQIAAHLQWLNDNRQLFVRPLVFDETLIADFKTAPSASDINNGFNMGLRWRQKPNGNYELTRLQSGRVVVANFDPMALSDQRRFQLNEKIKKNPSGFVYLDIQPNGPGGNFPIQGAIKLRSMFQILKFIATGIKIAPE